MYPDALAFINGGIYLMVSAAIPVSECLYAWVDLNYNRL